MHQPDWDEWWDLAQSSKSSTFFHSPLWGKLARIRGLEPSPLVTSFQDNQWLFPAVKQTRTLEKFGVKKEITILHSMFAGTYGEWVSPSGEKPSNELYAKLEREADIIRTTESPIFNSGSPDWSSEDDFTQIIDLSSGYSAIKSQFSDERENGIQTALETGVNVREADDLEDWEEYYQSYQASLERWDEPSSVYSWEFFEKLFEISNEYPENIRLWLAEIGGNLGSGALVFYWNNHVDYWHAASHAEYFDHKPNDLLQDRIIKDAVERNYGWYDFNPSGGHEGVVKFKQQFGPEKRTIQRREYKDSKLEFASSVLDKLGR